MKINYVLVCNIAILVYLYHMKAEEAHQKGLNTGQILAWEFVLEMIDGGNAHLLSDVAKRSIERLKLEQKENEKTDN